MNPKILMMDEPSLGLAPIVVNGIFEIIKQINADGKTMTVRMPENAGFWVYDAKGTITASSVLWDSDSVKLSKGGLVVFAGDPGAKFELSFQ